MKAISIIDNCTRLSRFYKGGDHPIVRKYMVSPEGLLKLCGRILDYNGAPAKNVSRLYLDNEDYMDLINYIQPIEEAGLVQNGVLSCLFVYYGYQWEVQNEDEINKQRVYVDELLKNKANNEG
jgi:hypothetical protein